MRCQMGKHAEDNIFKPVNRQIRLLNIESVILHILDNVKLRLQLKGVVRIHSIDKNIILAEIRNRLCWFFILYLNWCGSFLSIGIYSSNFFLCMKSLTLFKECLFPLSEWQKSISWHWKRLIHHHSEFGGSKTGIIWFHSCGTNLSHLFKPYQIIEPAVAFYIKGHSNTKICRCFTLWNWDLPIHHILHLLKSQFCIILQVQIFEVGQIDSTINRSRDQNFVLKEAHWCNGSWMLFQEMLLNTQNEINYYDGTIDQSYSQALKIIFKGLESSLSYLIRHCKNSGWLVWFNLRFHLLFHRSYSLFHRLILYQKVCLFHLSSCLLRSIALRNCSIILLDYLNKVRKCFLILLLDVQFSLHHYFTEELVRKVQGDIIFVGCLEIIIINFKCVLICYDDTACDEVFFHYFWVCCWLINVRVANVVGLLRDEWWTDETDNWEIFSTLEVATGISIFWILYSMST